MSSISRELLRGKGILLGVIHFERPLLLPEGLQASAGFCILPALLSTDEMLFRFIYLPISVSFPHDSWETRSERARSLDRKTHPRGELAPLSVFFSVEILLTASRIEL